MNKLLLMASLIGACFLACKKDSNPPKEEEETTTPTRDSVIVTKARFWASADTTLKYAVDSIVYQQDGLTIDKIITLDTSGNTVTNTFSYNTKGKITTYKMRSEGNRVYNRDYFFYYNNDETRIDSFMITDFLNVETTYGALTYNAKQQLTWLSSYHLYQGSKAQYYIAGYDRNAGGYIDSVKLAYGDDGIIFQRLSLNAPTAADSIVAFPPAIALWMGTRTAVDFLSFVRNTLMSQQFFLPGENILRSGAIKGSQGTAAVNIKYTGAMNLFSSETNYGGINSSYTLQLQYKLQSY